MTIYPIQTSAVRPQIITLPYISLPSASQSFRARVWADNLCLLTLWACCQRLHANARQHKNRQNAGTSSAVLHGTSFRGLGTALRIKIPIF